MANNFNICDRRRASTVVLAQQNTTVIVPDTALGQRTVFSYIVPANTLRATDYLVWRAMFGFDAAAGANRTIRNLYNGAAYFVSTPGATSTSLGFEQYVFGSNPYWRTAAVPTFNNTGSTAGVSGVAISYAVDNTLTLSVDWLAIGAGINVYLYFASISAVYAP